MGSAWKENVTCEKCGQKTGLRWSYPNTGEGGFRCRNCGWYRHDELRLFGRSLILGLRSILTQGPSWERIDPALEALAVECRENGYADSDRPLAQISALLSTLAYERGHRERAFVDETVERHALRSLRKGEAIMDHVEGYDCRDGTEWVRRSSSNVCPKGDIDEYWDPLDIQEETDPLDVEGECNMYDDD